MKSSKVLIYLITLSVLLTINISAQDGTLDSSFGVAGVLEAGGENVYIAQHKSLPDNKSLILSYKDSIALILKLNVDGSPDISFGENGYTNLSKIIGDTNPTFIHLRDFDITLDGKIVIGTVIDVKSDSVGGIYLTIIELNANGELNTEFGDNGIVKKELINPGNYGHIIDGSGRIRVTPNNNIIVTALNRENSSIASLLRLNSNGVFDNSFGTDGAFKYIHQTYGRNSLAIDLDGNIFYGDDYHIAKVFENGLIDDSFASSGYYNMALRVRDIDFQSDGKIIATYTTWNSDDSKYIPVISRITKNGVLDTSFAVNGVKDIHITTNSNILENTVIMPEDDIISGGYSYSNIDGVYKYEVILSKLTNNGSFAESFGDSGKVILDIYDNSEERASGLVVNSENYDITISAVREMPDSSRSLILARFLNSKIYSDIHVYGDVSGTWQPGTVYVDGDITIPQDQSLTIRPGTNVYFTGEYKFDIYGQLVANGTRTDSIFFFSDSLGKDEYYVPQGYWWGLGFKNLNLYQSRKSELSYCDFKYALSKEYNNYAADLDTDSIGTPIRLYKSSNVSLTHLTISECDAYFFGSLHLVNSSPDISNITIKNMRGRIQIRDNSNPKIKDLTFSEAGFVIIDSSPIIDNILIENYNRIPIIGHNFDGVITNSTFRNNTYYQKDAGAAFSLSEGSAAIFENVLFEGNQQLYASGYLGSGGAGFIRDSSPRFINCQFIGNISSGNGGAISTHSNDYSQYWISTFDNCLFVKNKAMNGGGTITTSTKTAVHLNNCTIADNTASWFAGVDNTGGGENIITNTIIYGNGPNFDQQMTTQWSSHILTYNIIEGEYYGKDTTSSNIHNVDPMFRDTSANDYHLQSIACGNDSDSPAIDAGDPSVYDFLLDCPTAGLGMGHSDIGAYGGANNWWDKSVLPLCHYRGNVSGVWDCETIYIDGDILIQEGDVLRITEDVNKILITGPYQIIVEGVLLAQGPEDATPALNGEQIKFQGSNWRGIVFNNLNDSKPGTSIIENCRFDYADKLDANYKNGGAIVINNSDNVILRGNVFYLNQAELGGAIYIENSNAHIENCHFNLNGRESGQNGVASATSGGAMYVKNSYPYMHKLFFIDNHSISGGGAIVLDNSSPTITNIMMVESFTAGFGGAMRLINGASPNIVNMSSSNNVAETAGGTLYLSTDSNPTITNSIMYENSKPEININGGVPTVTYSIIDSGSTESYFGEGCLEDNPYFVAGVEYLLANNNCDYSDGSTVVSTAIDAGHPDSLDSELDCRGGLGTSRADMGYYGGRYSETTVGVEDVKFANTSIPNEYKLMQNYPNPFNPSTTIQFALPKAGAVSLKIYNILGEEVATIINREMSAGFQSVNFDASHLSSGLYLYRINAGDFVDVKKMLLLK